MKPHLRKFYYGWVCKQSIFLGVGDTPLKAYEDFLREKSQAMIARGIFA